MKKRENRGKEDEENFNKEEREKRISSIKTSEAEWNHEMIKSKWRRRR